MKISNIERRNTRIVAGIFLLVLIIMMLASKANGQTMRVDKVVNYKDSLKVLQKDVNTTFEFSRGNMEMKIFFPTWTTSYNNLIYTDTDTGFIIECDNGIYHWYIYDGIVSMIKEIPFDNDGCDFRIYIPPTHKTYRL